MTHHDRITRQDWLNKQRLAAWRRKYRCATGHYPDVLRHSLQRKVGLDFPLAGWPTLRLLQWCAAMALRTTEAR